MVQKVRANFTCRNKVLTPINKIIKLWVCLRGKFNKLITLKTTVSCEWSRWRCSWYSNIFIRDRWGNYNWLRSNRCRGWCYWCGSRIGRTTSCWIGSFWWLCSCSICVSSRSGCSWLWLGGSSSCISNGRCITCRFCCHLIRKFSRKKRWMKSKKGSKYFCNYFLPLFKN